MKEENLYTPDCIRTFSGIYMNVFEPTLEMICIEDIAHALSMQPRFGGHLPKFYSVAQHSVNVALQSYTLQSLMHDAAEAYLMDIPSPIKKRLNGYKEIEDNLLKMIGEKFGFDAELTEETKKADLAMLEFEWSYFMLKELPKSSPKITPRVWHWSPEESENHFLHTFRLLSK